MRRFVVPALVVLQLVALVLIAHGQQHIESENAGIFWWKGDRSEIGPEYCAFADSRPQGHQDGTCAYFRDAIPNTSPMTCPCPSPPCPCTSPPCGAYCCHQHGEWDCFGSGSASCQAIGTSCTMNGQCCSNLCFLGMCIDCIPDGQGCSSNSSCCSGDCSSGVCVPINPCNPNPCVNGGTCVSSGPGVVCLCPCGFCGPTCNVVCTTTTTSTTTTTTTSTTTTVTTTTTTGTGPTTTSTTTTTLTTTTTSTTTTTLLASVTFLWNPEPGETQGALNFTADGTMFCNLWVPPIGILNATTLVFQVGTGSNSGNLGLAIYSADGSTRITSTGGIAVSAGAFVLTTTTGNFTLNAGTAYQVCFCANQVSGAREWYVARSLAGASLDRVQQVFTTPMSTTGANACVTGSPPLTTGALTGQIHAPVMALIATNTP